MFLFWDLTDGDGMQRQQADVDKQDVFTMSYI